MRSMFGKSKSTVGWRVGLGVVAVGLALVGCDGKSSSRGDGGGDALDGGGSADADVTPPILSDVSVSVVGSSIARVTWTTDEPATSMVSYGETVPDRVVSDEALVTVHSVDIGGLTPGVTYQVVARSMDGAGNESAADPLTVVTSIRDLQVRQDHPILFVNPSLVTQIREKTEDLARFDEYSTGQWMQDTTDPGATAVIRQEVDGIVAFGAKDAAMAYGVGGFIIGNALAKEYGRQLLRSLLDRAFSFADGDSDLRGKLYAMGALYDWLYDDLDEALKAEVRLETLDLLDYIQENRSTLLEPHHDSHSRLANICALVAIVPLFHDVEQDGQNVTDRYFDWLSYIVSNWRDFMNPAQEWINEGGGHQMGWAYGSSYASFDPYFAWEFAVEEESWFQEWQENRIFWYLYALRNTNTNFSIPTWDNFPYWGDVWNTEYYYGSGALQIMTAGQLFGNETAQWLSNNVQPTYRYRAVFDILYRHYSEESGVAPDDLPLARHFPNSGNVIIRDTWDFEKNTLMVFKSGSFAALNHHHKDQNAFTLYYKGPLAIDSGGYNVCGQWGSDHWWNYYTRTIAHNSVLVYDPNEVFDYGGVRSNDGGQMFLGDSYPYLDQLLEGGDNHLDGIGWFEHTPDYTYAMGDATRAYSPAKMGLFQRSIVYLRNHSYDHPVVLVFDQVVSTDPGFKKTYLLHSINEPVISGDTVTIQIDDGVDPANEATLYQQTLWPSDFVLTKVGGRANGEDFYVADDGTGVGHNYSEDCDYASTSVAIGQVGEWRIEVSPQTPSLDDVFLHVLSVTDEQASYSAVGVDAVSSNHLRGAIVSDNDGQQATLVLFSDQATDLDEVVDLTGTSAFHQILIVGLEPNEAYEVTTDTTSLTLRPSTESNQTASDHGTLYLSVP